MPTTVDMITSVGLHLSTRYPNHVQSLHRIANTVHTSHTSIYAYIRHLQIFNNMLAHERLVVVVERAAVVKLDMLLLLMVSLILFKMLYTGHQALVLKKFIIDITLQGSVTHILLSC